MKIVYHFKALKALHRYYNNILFSLHPLFGQNEPDEGVRDNASGAVARMIMAQPHAIPFSQVVLMWMIDFVFVC